MNTCHSKPYLLRARHVCAIMFLLLYLFSCTPAEQSGQSAENPAGDSVPPNSRAFDMMQSGTPFHQYMAVQMEAVKQLRDGHPQSDAIEILAQTGNMLMRHGNYTDALEYLQEASDSARLRLRRRKPDGAMARLHANLSGIYSRFGLFDEALAESRMAIQTSSMLDNIYAPDIWRMRGAVFSMMMEGAPDKAELADSVLYCLDMARSHIKAADPDLQDKLHDKCNFDQAALYVENPTLFADSIEKATLLLQPTDAGGSFAVSKNVLLGRARVLAGRYDEGIALIEQGLDEFREQNWQESIDWALQLLATSYAEAGRGRELVAIYPDVKAVRDSVINRTKMNTLVGADFKYRMREKQHQVESLQQENARSGKIIFIGSMILLFGLLAGAVLAFTYIKLKSKSHREGLEYQKQISDILSHQVTLNHKIEQLNEQLEKKENGELIDNAIGQLNPTLLSGEDETKFRRAFVSLYPGFLKKMRRNYPELTASEELLCMLIYLKVPAIDMAASLGISRPSLNSARYRLRKRLCLDKTTDLDTFIQTQ